MDMKSKDVGLIVRAIRFQDFRPMWSWSTVTDRQMDGQTTSDSKTALCTVVHHKVKINVKSFKPLHLPVNSW